jgi:hypothetical protein
MRWRSLAARMLLCDYYREAKAELAAPQSYGQQVRTVYIEIKMNCSVIHGNPPTFPQEHRRWQSSNTDTPHPIISG